jgi:hypothetical protein
MRHMISRRSAIAGSLSIAFVQRALSISSALSAEPSGSAGLRLSPPTLNNPTKHFVTDDNCRLTNIGPGDHVLVLPDRPLTKTLIVDGRNVARHIVLIGGEIAPAGLHDPSTMKLLDGSDYAVYSRIGFSGATGGTFRIRAMSAPWYWGQTIPVTDPLPYDASPAAIRAAINQCLGASDACFVVDGPQTPGGPWKIVPGNNAALGRCSIISDLTGPSSLVAPEYKYAISPHCVDFKQWTGTLHVEGLLAGANSPWCGDATNIQTKHATASAQFANCHFAANFDAFNNDWNHPDGSQFYLGPAKFFAENVDFISKGGNGFIGQPRDADGTNVGSLEALYDWWFRNVQFRCFRRDDDKYIPDMAVTNNGTAAFQETDWPNHGDNGAGWTWLMENCFANKYSCASGAPVTDAIKSSYYNYFVKSYPTHFEYPQGLTLNAAPPTKSGFFCDPQSQCGIGYVPVGYTNEPSPGVKQRLAGETLVN